MLVHRGLKKAFIFFYFAFYNAGNPIQDFKLTLIQGHN